MRQGSRARIPAEDNRKETEALCGRRRQVAQHRFHVAPPISRPRFLFHADRNRSLRGRWPGEREIDMVPPPSRPVRASPLPSFWVRARPLADDDRTVVVTATRFAESDPATFPPLDVSVIHPRGHPRNTPAHQRGRNLLKAHRGHRSASRCTARWAIDATVRSAPASAIPPERQTRWWLPQRAAP